MARETVAQRNARFDAERKARQEALQDNYPTLLLDTLERASRLSYELTVKDAKFLVRAVHSHAKWAMTPLYTDDSQDTLEALVYDVQDEEDRRDEAERKYQAKQAALSKLTDTEKELLGLK